MSSADDASTQDELAAPESDGERVVRAYYAAHRGDQRRELDAVLADDAELIAPSIKYLQGRDRLVGKKAFIDAEVPVKELLAGAVVRSVVAAADGKTFIARIELPLPKGPLTQIEFFTVEGGKIARLESFYDSLPLLASLPELKARGIVKLIEDLLQKLRTST